MPRGKQDPQVTPFTQHGFVHLGTSNDEAFGICPFCGDKKHRHAHTFYVNRFTHNWNCKSCTRDGGYQTFLREIHQKSVGCFKGEVAIALSKERGISLKILRRCNIGFNPVNGTYLIPIMDSQKEKLWDLRIFNGKTMRSTSGCKVGLFGWGEAQRNPSSSTIWLCEGEWDGMVMLEILDTLQIKDQLVMAVPGAGTFKADWESYFEGKQVKVIYDADNAGQDGARKVYNILKPLTSNLQFIHWPSASRSGFDLRDLYHDLKKDSAKVFGYLKTLLSSVPPGIDDSKAADFVQSTTSLQVVSLTGEGVHTQEVYTVYRKWLELSSTDVIDVLYGAVLGNRLPGPPLWLFLVGPPGGLKSELIMSISKAPLITTTTTLTIPSLISGVNTTGGRDPSLLKIMNERILAILDFTAITSMNPLVLEELFGLFRGAYDGVVEKRFGNGVHRKYDPCKFGIIAGVTPAIEIFSEMHTALGERFLRYRTPVSDSLVAERDVLRRAIANTTHEDEMQKDLSDIGKRCLDHTFDKIPEISNDILEKIVLLAQYTAILRATIIRDKFTKEITHRPFRELGTRLVKQFCKLLIGIGMFRGLSIITEAEYLIIKDVALDTIPSRMRDMIENIYRIDPMGKYDIRDLSPLVGLSPQTTERMAENLGMLNVLKKDRLPEFKRHWLLTDELREIIDRADIY